MSPSHGEAIIRGPGYLALLLALFIGPVGNAKAEPPTFEGHFPLGAPVGQEVALSIAGKFDRKTLRVWTSNPALQITTPADDKQPFRASVAKEAPLGPVWVRLMDANGVSSARLFAIGNWPESQEAEPNNAYSEANTVSEPLRIMNGKLEKAGDVDSFKVALDQGQWLIADVDALQLDSAVDPLIQVVDAQGTALAFVHDDTDSLDPFVAFRAPSKGEYVVQLSGFAMPPQANSRLAGGPNIAYRLLLTTGPYLRRAFPSQLPKGQATEVELVGWNFGQAVPSRKTLEPKHCGTIPLELGPIAGLAVLPVSEAECLMEREANDQPSQARVLAVPGSFHGKIQSSGDIDLVRFIARKGKTYHIALVAASLGSPLDALLELKDASGKSLATQDDGKDVLRPDPTLDWTAPADGDFVISLRDLEDRGGEDFVYRLEITQPAPRCEATLEGGVWTLAAGKKLDIKVTLRRQYGHAEAVEIQPKDLPEGVQATPLTIGADKSEGVLTLEAAANAKLGSSPIQFKLRDSRGEQAIALPIKGAIAEEGELLLNQDTNFWLTITSAEAAK